MTKTTDSLTPVHRGAGALLGNEVTQQEPGGGSGRTQEHQIY